tara:strand:+ start:414 stop:965 length:552 start_codon:yes stop_codon:yes gene_type:complete
MAWVERWLGDLVPGSRVLDFACGRGRHAVLAAGKGHRVLAVDRNAEALAGLAAPIETLCSDLEADPWPFADQQFDAVIVTNYLFRPRLAQLGDLLAPGGRLIYATFGQGNEAYGRPSNPDFLLAPGELLELARRLDLQVAGFESGVCGEPPAAVVERLCAWRQVVPGTRVSIDCPVNDSGQLK